MINSLGAFSQKLDFEKLYPFSSSCTDFDGVFRLNNEVILIVEVKKETDSHSVDNFLKTEQYRLIRDIIGNREDIYFVYVTHQNYISKDIPIEASDCVVKFVLHASNLTVIDSGILLTDFTKSLSRNRYMQSEYFIMVKYQNTQMEYCMVSPKSKIWSSKTYTPENNKFSSLKEVESYISQRFLFIPNHTNEYWVFKKDNEATTLLNIYKYKTIELETLNE